MNPTLRSAPTPTLKPVVVKTKSADQFLALVPQLVGFVPTQSVVLVAFRGKRTCGALRLDLPVGDAAVALNRFATTAIGLACKVQGIDGVAAVIYTDESFGDSHTVPHAPLLDALVKRAQRAGLRVRDALCVDADGWGSHFDADLPFGGRLLDALTTGGPATEALEHFDARPLLDRDAAVTLPEATEDDRARFSDRMDVWRLPIEKFGCSRIQGFLVAMPPIVMLESLLYPVEPDDLDQWLGMLAVLATVPSLRDLALLQFGWGPAFGHYVYEQTIARDEQTPLDPDGVIANAFSGGDFERPDVARITTAIERVRQAASLTPPPDRAPLLTMLGWLHWSLGHGSIAGDIVSAALAAEPEYGLATLLATMLNNGMLPEWAYRERSSDAGPSQWGSVPKRIA